MNLTKPQLIIIGAVGLVVLVLVLVFTGILPGLKNEKGKIRANLEFWGVFDTLPDYETAVGNFKKIYPDVTVNYRGFSNVKEYETTLLDSLAAGKGPDIFMIRNRSLPREINKIVSVPPTKLSLIQLRNLFPQVVEADFAPQGAIYALPLSLDTLALIYNQDFFNQAAIIAPPETWEDFESLIPKLIKRDPEENITRAAAAIGGSLKTIDRAGDILSILMLQTGAKMVSDDFGAATFASNEGLNALNFYVKFADPESQAYTWDDSFPGALDAFSEEFVVMIFDYASAIPEIKSKNPFINFAVSPLPQPESADRSVAYPDYWGYAVSRQAGRYQNIAWDFVIALTTKTNNARGYFNKTRKPPALRTLINERLNDPDLDVFVRQALVARSWPQIDPDGIEQIFSGMIESVVTGGSSVRDAIEQAEESVTRLMQRRL
ncbi:MAG: extracellular solute-binding protein [Patescibacteria group bacterium]|nr:extracellular solute-binding protein [Patescibacteria group bacterium]